MCRPTVLVFAIVACIQASPTEHKKYTNWNVIEATPTDDQQLQALKELRNSKRDVHFLSETEAINRSAEILLPSSNADAIKKHLALQGLTTQLMIRDFQQLIDKERSRDYADSLAQFKESDHYSQYRHDKYHSHAEINNFLRSLARGFPTIAEVFLLGRSGDGREILGMKISGRSTGAKKRAIYVDAGVHAREWVAPASGIYIIHTLITQYGKTFENASDTNADVTALVDVVDWYVTPLVNPDGYEYSRSSTGDRMWRKTRSRNFCHFWTCCYGTDLNRNFGHRWGDQSEGTSHNPCSDVYRGRSAFSEPESQATRRFILAKRDVISGYISLHSYSQMWLIPFGYNNPAHLPEDFDELKTVAEEGTQAIEAVYGTKYTLGNSATLLYSASGASDDWAKGTVGIKYTYTLELRPSEERFTNEDADAGKTGFMLAAAEIIPTAVEVLQGIKVVASKIGEMSEPE